MKNGISFKVIRQEENAGLGRSLGIALENCSFDLVARMDSDDISLPYRFAVQMDVFEKEPETDIVGGYISEFVGDPENITGIREVELCDSEIRADMRSRCAMNHVSVMFRKGSVESAGGYLDWYSNEDYYLWIRMMENGCKFRNVPYVLVNVRTGEGMSSRRGGWRYFKSEQGIQKLMLDKGMIGPVRYVKNVAVRLAGEVIASNRMRQMLYRILRKRPESADGLIPEQAQLSPGKEHEPFSVALSVYGKDDPDCFDIALESLLSQTLVPDEIVLVVDGPVPEGIDAVIKKYAALCG